MRNLTSEDMVKLTLNDMQILFNEAKSENCLEYFTEWFWPAYDKAITDSENVSMQDILDTLESYKRNLGRRYGKNKCKYDAILYNKTESQIQWLVNSFVGLKRNTYEYKIDIV